VEGFERAAADIPLTKQARDVLERAVDIASQRRAEQVSPVDVLKATLTGGGTRAVAALRALGREPSSIEALIGGDDGSAAIPLRQLLVNANREAQVLGHYQVDPIHLLLALMYSDTPVTASALQKAGVTLYDLRSQLQLGAPAALAPGATGVPRQDAALRRKPLLSLRGVLGISLLFYGLVAMTAASGVLLWFDVLPQAATVMTIVFVTSGWVTSLCVHEFGHAAVAYLGGDRSVAAAGYLTLDPLRYTSLLGSIILPVVFLLLGGIAMPGGAVYINQGALRSRAWSSLVSAAGPAATLLFGLLVAIPFLVPGHRDWVTVANANFFGALAVLAWFQAAAVVLNLLPIPGLDGFGILRPWLPYSVQDAVNRFSQLATIAVFLLLWYFAPARQAYFSAVFNITNAVGVDIELIIFGFQHLRFA